MTMIPWKFRSDVPSTKYMDPFANMSKLVDDYFGNFLAGPNVRAMTGWGNQAEENFIPKIDVREGDNEVDVTAELPGMNQKDVEVFLDDNILTLKGEKKQEREGSDKDRYYKESSYGAFQRTMTLPFEADREKIKAQFKDGVLKVHLIKSERAKDTRRKIDIS